MPSIERTALLMLGKRRFGNAQRWAQLIETQLGEHQSTLGEEEGEEGADTLNALVYASSKIADAAVVAAKEDGRVTARVLSTMAAPGGAKGIGPTGSLAPLDTIIDTAMGGFVSAYTPSASRFLAHAAHASSQQKQRELRHLQQAEELQQYERMQLQAAHSPGRVPLSPVLNRSASSGGFGSPTTVDLQSSLKQAMKQMEQVEGGGWRPLPSRPLPLPLPPDTSVPTQPTALAIAASAAAAAAASAAAQHALSKASRPSYEQTLKHRKADAQLACSVHRAAVLECLTGMRGLALDRAAIGSGPGAGAFTDSDLEVLSAMLPWVTRTVSMEPTAEDALLAASPRHGVSASELAGHPPDVTDEVFDGVHTDVVAGAGDNGSANESANGIITSKGMADPEIANSEVADIGAPAEVTPQAQAALSSSAPGTGTGSQRRFLGWIGRGRTRIHASLGSEKADGKAEDKAAAAAGRAAFLQRSAERSAAAADPSGRTAFAMKANERSAAAATAAASPAKQPEPAPLATGITLASASALPEAANATADASTPPQHVASQQGMVQRKGAVASGRSAAECYSIERVELASNRLSDVGIESLCVCAAGTGALSCVRVLTLTDNRIRGVVCPHLGKTLGAAHGLPRLNELSLSLNRINDVGMLALADELHHRALPYLWTLRLDSNRIGDDGVCALARALGRGAMASLSTLDLAGNRISDQGLESLVRVACEHGKALGHLTTLDLSANKLGSSRKAAAHPRARGLFERARPEDADEEEGSAAQEKGADQGVATLASALAVGYMPTLRTLKLNGNRIGDRGARALATAGRRGGAPALRALWLCDNQIRSAGVQALANAVADTKAFCALATLVLGGNPGADESETGAKGRAALVAAVGSGPRAVLSLGDSTVIDGRSVKARAGEVQQQYLSMRRLYKS